MILHCLITKRKSVHSTLLWFKMRMNNNKNAINPHKCLQAWAKMLLNTLFYGKGIFLYSFPSPNYTSQQLSDLVFLPFHSCCYPSKSVVGADLTTDFEGVEGACTSPHLCTSYCFTRYLNFHYLYLLATSGSTNTKVYYNEN